MAGSSSWQFGNRVLRLDRPHRVGLLAGSGRFPILFAQAARRQGHQVVCVGIRSEADPELAELCKEFHWAGIARLGRIIRLFRRARVSHVVMAGKVTKKLMFQPWRILQFTPDLRTIGLWYRRLRGRRNDDTLLLHVINEFGRDGIQFDTALNYCPELLARRGCVTRRVPKRSEWQDIQYGWELAKEMGRLDVGQSVAVKEQAVLAVEAIEGTDQAILRAGQLCPAGGFTVVKVAKPHQDMRFDVPTIGTDTIETLHRAGGRVLAIEAEKTIVLDQSKVIELADRHGIALVAVDPEGEVLPDRAAQKGAA